MARSLAGVNQRSSMDISLSMLMYIIWNCEVTDFQPYVTQCSGLLFMFISLCQQALQTCFP